MSHRMNGSISTFIRINLRGGKLHQHLRHQKTYRKRGYKNTDRRGQLVDRTSIHCRDEVIEKRQRLGDFEGDTVIGKNHKGALLTLVERKSLYVHIVHLGQTRTTAKTISCALACLRSSHAYSVTFDNGKEFSEHRADNGRRHRDLLCRSVQVYSTSQK